MSLNLEKLENRKPTTGGKITARCPARALKGGDSKGVHLVVFPDGGYGCVVHPKDKAHRKIIFELVGDGTIRDTETNRPRPFPIRGTVKPRGEREPVNGRILLPARPD